MLEALPPKFREKKTTVSVQNYHREILKCYSQQKHLLLLYYT